MRLTEAQSRLFSKNVCWARACWWQRRRGEKGGMSGSAKRANKATKDIKVTNSKTAELWSESFYFLFHQLDSERYSIPFDTHFHTCCCCCSLGAKVLLFSSCCCCWAAIELNSNSDWDISWLKYIWWQNLIILICLLGLAVLCLTIDCDVAAAALAHTTVAVAVSLENFLRSKRDDRPATMNLRVL